MYIKRSCIKLGMYPERVYHCVCKCSICVYFIIYDDYLYSISIFIIYIQNVAILVHKVTISTL